MSRFVSVFSRDCGRRRARRQLRSRWRLARRSRTCTTSCGSDTRRSNQTGQLCAARSTRSLPHGQRRSRTMTRWPSSLPSAEAADLRYDVTTGPLDARELEAAVTHPGAGAICTFTGIVRDNSRGQSVTHLDYEAFAEMAVPQMRKIGDYHKSRWRGARGAMAHRTGHLEIGEASVVVCVSAPHREEAIAACRWGIDTLKESVPIWKKEHAADGTFWIEGHEAKPAG